MILADSHTLSACVEPLREACPALADAPVITVEAGDVNKNLDSLRHIWEQMQQLGATRRSTLRSTPTIAAPTASTLCAARVAADVSIPTSAM